MSLFSINPDFQGLTIDDIMEVRNNIIPEFVDRSRDFALAIASQQAMSMEVFDFIQQGLSVSQQGDRILIETNEQADFFEKGWQPFDLGQEILSNSKNVKVSEEGHRYAHVPIYQNGLTRVNPFTEKGYRSRALNQGAMRSSSNPYGIKKKPKDLIPDARRYARSKDALRYKNERPPKYNTEGGVFRTVSDKSTNWQHPGLPAFRFAEMAADYMGDALSLFLQVFMEGRD